MSSSIARRFAYAALALVALLAVAAGVAWWLASRQQTLEWLIAEAVRRSNGALQVEGVSGSVLGPIALRRVVYDTEGMRITLEDVRVDASPRDLARGTFTISELEARLLRLETKPSDRRLEAPTSLALPVRVHIARAAVGAANVAGYALRDVRFAYDGDTALQALREFSAQSVDGRITGELRIEASSPFVLRAQAAVAGADLLVEGKVTGSLLRPEAMVEAALRQARATASARLAPFEPRWLDEFRLQATQVDLAAFRRGWPSTLLEVEASGSGMSADSAGGSFSARNRRAGSFQSGRVPVAALRGEYVVRANRLELTRTRADLGAAGVLAGNARLARDSGRADVTVSGLNLRALFPEMRATRLNGKASAEYKGDTQHVRAALREQGIQFALDATHRGDLVTVHEAEAAAAGGLARGRGQINLAQPRRYSADVMLKRLDPSRFGDFPRASLNGELKLAGALAPAWSADAALTLGESTWRGVRLTGYGKGLVSARGVRDLDVALTAGANELRAQGGYGQPQDALTFTLDAKRLADLDANASGMLTARGRIAGTIDNLALDADISGSSLRWQGGPLIAMLKAHAAGGAARHTVDIQARGERFDMNARAEGGWSRERGWNGTLAAFENKGAWPAALAAPMPVAYARDRLSAGPADLRVAGGRLHVASLTWQDGRIATRGQVAQLPVAPFLELAGVAATGTDLRIGGSWALASTPRLNGTVTLTRESGDFALPGDNPLLMRLERLRLDAHVANDAVDAKVDVAGLWLTGTLQARTQGITPDAPLKAEGKFDVGSLRLLEPLIGTRAVLSGRAQATVAASGTLGAPYLTGAVSASNLGVEAPQYGVRLREGTLRAELDSAALTLREFRVKGGDGYLTANGVMSRNGNGAAKLEWRAQDFQALDRPDMRLRVAGSGTVGLEAKKLTVRGSMTAQQGYFRFDRPTAPRLGNDIVVVGRPRTQPASALRTRFESQLMDIDVTLDAGRQVHLIGSGIDTDLAGKLRITTNRQGMLQASGTLVTSRGIYFAFGQQLTIERGRLTFNGPLENPTLDILAKRRTLQVEVGVEITGTVHVPRVQLVSEPPLPDNEKLAWLTLGHGLEDATGADIALLQAAASALFSDGSSLPFTRRLANKLRVDDISLRGGGQAGSQVAAIGKRISDRVYIEYQQGLELASAAVRLSYALTRAISLRLEAGATSSVGVFYNRSYR